MASTPPRADEARSPRLLASLRRLGVTIVAILHTRIELVATEFERERARVIRLAIVGLAALFFLALGALTFTIFVIVLFWDSQRLLVIGFITLAYLGIGAALAVFAKREAARSMRPFSATLAQLRKDREQLTSD